MKIFLDTANTEEIKTGVAAGCVSGITTNPTIISRENKSLKKCIEDIVNIDSKLTILIEAVSSEAGSMVKEARELTRLAPEVVIKLPMTIAGLSAARILSKEGVSTAITLVFSLNQAIAASCAGADYVAPFVGRMDDMNADGLALVRSIKETLTLQGAKTKVISASVRTPQSVSQLFSVGCDIVTVPGSILAAMFRHPLTEAGLKKFEEDWKKVPVHS